MRHVRKTRLCSRPWVLESDHFDPLFSLICNVLRRPELCVGTTGCLVKQSLHPPAEVYTAEFCRLAKRIMNVDVIVNTEIVVNIAMSSAAAALVAPAVRRHTSTVIVAHGLGDR